MASFPLLLLNLSLFLLLLSSVQASYEEVEVENGAHSPHGLPTFPPVPAPKPHKGGHHHHHPNSPLHPPVHPPAHSPAKPPVHTPAKPPVHTPAKPPVNAPAKPPVHTPAKPPAHSPAKPPVHPIPHPVPERKLIAVQGVVYCKSCKFIGVDTLWKATPLRGSVVKLTCNNTKYKPVEEEGTTDNNGYFLIMPKGITNAAYTKCRVFLVSSNTTKCDVPTNFNGALKGATLTPNPKPPAQLAPMFDFYDVGPLAFEPSKKIPCAK